MHEVAHVLVVLEALEQHHGLPVFFLQLLVVVVVLLIGQLVLDLLQDGDVGVLRLSLREVEDLVCLVLFRFLVFQVVDLRVHPLFLFLVVWKLLL